MIWGVLPNSPPPILFLLSSDSTTHLVCAFQTDYGCCVLMYVIILRHAKAGPSFLRAVGLGYGTPAVQSAHAVCAPMH